MAEDLDWIAELAGGPVTRCERAATGASRGTWLVDVERRGGTAHLVLRRDTGDGPLSDTPLTLEREAEVYRALAGSGVAIPALVGMSPSRDALLVERVRGSDDFASIADAAEQLRVAESFIRALATLHRVDTRPPAFDAFRRPVLPEEHAALEIDLWEGIFASRVRRAVPLLAFAFDWLRRHAPRHVQRTVVCHGDAGPGNFLFERGEVTAILDWEFAHLGDPLDDIAWLGVRAHLLGFPALPPLLRLYEQESGVSVEPRSVRFYQALVLARMAVSCLAALDNRPPAGEMQAATYLNLLPVLQHWLARLLGELVGLDDAPAAEAVGWNPGDPEVGETVDVLVGEMSDFVLPLAEEPAKRRRAMSLLSLLLHLQQQQRAGGSVRAAELHELHDLLGSPPSDLETGRADLLERVRHGVTPEGASDESLLRHFRRQTQRRVATLWPILAGLAQNPPPLLQVAR